MVGININKPKAEVPAAMNFMKEFAINVRLITGDNIQNASLIATKQSFRRLVLKLF